MKIPLNQIPAEGRDETVAYGGSQLDLERDDVRPGGPVRLTAHVFRTRQTVLVRGRLSCELEMTCARCLGAFSRSLDKPIALTYHVTHEASIDVTDGVREEVLLEYPMVAVCRPDCRGLCPGCGCDRNRGSCSCPTEAAPSRPSGGGIPV